MVLWVFLDKITEQIKQKRDWRTGPGAFCVWRSARTISEIRKDPPARWKSGEGAAWEPRGDSV